MLYDYLYDLFLAARGEFFEDGMESYFSRGLEAAIQTHKHLAVGVLRVLVVDIHLSPSVVGEAMRWIGSVDEPDTWECRRSLLEYCLEHPNPEVRDGAGLGLAAMDDPKAIPAVWRAINREQLSILRRGLQQVLDQLVETRDNHP